MKYYHSIIVKTAHFDNSTSKLGLAYERITERTNRCKITGMNVNDLVQHALMQLFRLAFATKRLCKAEIESPPRFCDVYARTTHSPIIKPRLFLFYYISTDDPRAHSH